MSKAIITMPEMNVVPRTFKDKRLDEATQKIADIYTLAREYAADKNREIAKILDTVAEDKLYVKDGFKSVADYANQIFGIEKQNAYMLARAGKIYNDKKASDELKAFSPSNLHEIRNVPREALEQSIKDGTINSNSTQKVLREYAKAQDEIVNADKPKTEVLKQYTARPCQKGFTERELDDYGTPKTLEEWDDYFTQVVANISPDSPVETVKLPKMKSNPKSIKATVNRTLYFNRCYSMVVEFPLYTPPKKSAAKAKPKATVEDIMSMVNEMPEEMRKALLNAVFDSVEFNDGVLEEDESEFVERDVPDVVESYTEDGTDTDEE